MMGTLASYKIRKSVKAEIERIAMDKNMTPSDLAEFIFLDFLANEDVILDLEEKPNSYVYLVADRSKNVCKIGSSIDMSRRMRELKNHKVFDFSLTHIMLGDHRMEKALQSLFRDYQVKDLELFNCYLGKEIFWFRHEITSTFEKMGARKVSEDSYVNRMF